MTHKIELLLDHENSLRQTASLAEDGRPLARQVFFEPDNWLVPEDFDPLLAAHAELAVVVSGHSYGTGSNRFFWLMGDRRAMAVRAALLRAGAQAGQVLVQSRGAARPEIELAGKDVARYRRRVTIDYLPLDAAQAHGVPAEGSAPWWRSVFGVRRGGSYRQTDLQAEGPEALPGAQSSAASSPGNNTSVKPNCVKSRMRIG